MNPWLWSDPHFFHPMMAERRGFADEDHMNNYLVALWNERVRDNHEAFILGDLSFGSYDETLELLRRMRGHIRFVPGNHDSGKIIRAVEDAGWEILPELTRRKLGPGEQRTVLCHYRQWTWANAHHGVLHVHGHSHGSAPEDNTCTDVGVDGIWGPGPVQWQTVRAVLRLRTYKVVDHHRKGKSRWASALKWIGTLWGQLRSPWSSRAS